MAVEYATMTSKGQLVVPSRLRRKYGLRKGTRFAFAEDNGRLILQPITREYIRMLTGCLKGGPPLLEYLLAERKKDRIL